MTTVLITGANRGIGVSLVKEYAADGAQVIACCRTPAKADALKDIAASAGGRVRILPLDVGDEASITALKKTLGDEPIDILLNNAGMLGAPKDQSIRRIDAENWIHTMRVNALGPVLLSIALVDNLRRGGSKRVCAITSSSGSNEKDFYGAASPVTSERYAYRASKAALNNGMRGLARDWAGEGILVALLDPGWVRTDMGGKGALEAKTSISADQSAKGIKDRIPRITPETSGVFQRFWGEPLPW
jgi:NAD(P)-dependent dehydrogenase (short-subunit alcohol dehydrogenase family)